MSERGKGDGTGRRRNVRGLRPPPTSPNPSVCVTTSSVFTGVGGPRVPPGVGRPPLLRTLPETPVVRTGTHVGPLPPPVSLDGERRPWTKGVGPPVAVSCKCTSTPITHPVGLPTLTLSGSTEETGSYGTLDRRGP